MNTTHLDELLILWRLIHNLWIIWPKASFFGISLKDLCVHRLAWYRQGCGSGYGQKPGIFINPVTESGNREHVLESTVVDHYHGRALAD